MHDRPPRRGHPRPAAGPEHPRRLPVPALGSGEAGLTQDGKAEVSLKLSALGQALPGDGAKIAVEHAREICQAASNAGTTVTLDMEDHTTVDATLEAPVSYTHLTLPT